MALLLPTEKLDFLIFTMKANEQPTKMIPLGRFGGLEVLSALAVPFGLASAASFVCVVIVSFFIANPPGMEGAGVMSFWSL